MSIHYPQLITEQNFHWTYEQWQEYFNDKFELYEEVCNTIKQMGYPDISERFEYFVAHSLAETNMKVLVRMLSCFYAYEQGLMTFQDTKNLVGKLAWHTSLALREINYFHYGDNSIIVISLEEPPPEQYT